MTIMLIELGFSFYFVSPYISMELSDLEIFSYKISMIHKFRTKLASFAEPSFRWRDHNFLHFLDEREKGPGPVPLFSGTPTRYEHQAVVT